MARRALRRAAQQLAPPAAELEPGAWRLERDPLGRLCIDSVALGDVAARFGTPVHVVDAVRLRENAARFVNCPTAHGGGVETFYPYKANPVPGVLRALHQIGAGAEVASPYELWLAKTLGVAPGRIVFNCPIKPAGALRQAMELGVGLITVGSRQELPAISAMARSLGKRPRIGIRVAVPGATSHFGESTDDGSALQAFAEALERPELDVVALHAHPNAELATHDELRAFVAAVLRFAARLRTRLKLDLEVIDLGGNLVCPTVAQVSPIEARVQMALGREAAPPERRQLLSIEDYVGLATTQIEAHYKREGRPMPRVFVEPGRSMTSSAQLLMLGVVQVRPPDDSGVSTVVLDGGINVAEPLVGERHQVFAVSPRPNAEKRTYRLIGPTGASNDLLYPSVVLPELQSGDTLAVMDSGAYFVPTSTTWSFPRPGIVMLDRGELTLLRRAETFEDLVALDLLEAA
ncbi:MAG: pyridoxal-dependent decarboxylase [Myxococcaceae bacterium]|nr:pyridoxal-dependent decarboxylase [Myxococcaceae bacterium]